MGVCERPDPKPWQSLIIALGEADAVMRASPTTTQKANLSPVPGLGYAWARVADDGTAEFSIACALASLCGVTQDNRRVMPGMRGNIIPIDLATWYPRFPESMDSKDAVFGRGPLVDGLIRVLLRRLHRARDLGLRFPPLTGAFPVPLSHLMAFVDGRVSDERIAVLLRGLSAVKWDEWLRARTSSEVDIGEQPTTSELQGTQEEAPVSLPSSPPGADGSVEAALDEQAERDPFVPAGTFEDPAEQLEDPDIRPPIAFSLLRIAYLPYHLSGLGDGDEGVPYDPAPLRAAAAGRMDDALRRVTARLRGVGVQPLIRQGVSVSPRQARRMVAAVLIPVAPRTARRMVFDATRSPDDSRPSPKVSQATEQVPVERESS